MDLSTKLGDITLYQILNIYIQMVILIGAGATLYGLYRLGRWMLKH